MTRQSLLLIPGLLAAVAGACLLPSSARPDDEAVQPPATAREAASPQAARALAPVDLSGRWLLTLPAGYQHRVAFERLEDGRFRVPGSLAFAGIYRLDGDQLMMDEPVDKRLTVFTWKIHNVNSLTLIDETGKSGARYAGATLGRQIEWDGQLSRIVPRVAVRATAPRSITLRAADIPAESLDRLIGRSVQLEGKAFNDADQGPYLETEKFIVFIADLEAWPDDVLETNVVVKGKLRADQLETGGERLRIHVLDLETYHAADEE